MAGQDGMREATAAMAQTVGNPRRGDPPRGRKKQSKREFVFLRAEERGLAVNRYNICLNVLI